LGKIENKEKMSRDYLDEKDIKRYSERTRAGERHIALNSMCACETANRRRV